MKQIFLLFCIIIIDLILLIYALKGLSISYHEADIFFNHSSALHYLVSFSTKLFGQNDFALRIPFLSIHVINSILIFLISKNIVKKPNDSIFAVLLYLLLPGINASALVVNEASSAILLTLLFIYLWQKQKRFFSYIVLFVSFGIDNSFSILYLSLCFYAIVKKNSEFAMITLLLFAFSIYFYGFDSGGKPSGYFLDTMGVYSAALSPLLFLYYIYTLYRIAVKEEKHILWYVSFFAFIITLLLSLRQRLMLEDFLPFAVIAIPLLVKTFFNSFRVRLPQFRKMHKIASYLVLFFLFSSFVLVIENRFLYLFLENPQKHFAYNHNVAKELSRFLLEKKYNFISVKDEKLALRLKFYGIKEGKEYKLSDALADKNSVDSFSLKVGKKTIAKYAIIKN